MNYDDLVAMDADIAARHPDLKPYRPQRIGFVYFIQEGEDGPIKIGWAKDPRRRLASMQSGNPRRLHLLGAIKTKRRLLERELHDRFIEDHLTGEWFSPSSELLALIGSPEQAA